MMHKARKRFGQNFLVDEHIIADIIRAIHPEPADNMVEIGPGLGALTRFLLQHVNLLHVIEIDRDIVTYLKNNFAGDKLIIHAADALKFDLAQLFQPQFESDTRRRQASDGAEGWRQSRRAPTGLLLAGEDSTNSTARSERGSQHSSTDKKGLESPISLRIVGNLPYNISSPLLFHFAEQAPRIRDMHFMLQREVVERMVAAPSTPEYGRLSVMLQYRFNMEKLLDVPPESFRPMPKVHSAVVRMTPLPAGEIKVASEARFAEIVTAAFGQRRKTLRNTLRQHLSEEDFVQLGLNAQLRAENLSVDDFVNIANHVQTSV